MGEARWIPPSCLEAAPGEMRTQVHDLCRGKVACNAPSRSQALGSHVSPFHQHEIHFNIKRASNRPRAPDPGVSAQNPSLPWDLIKVICCNFKNRLFSTHLGSCPAVPVNPSAAALTRRCAQCSIRAPLGPWPVQQGHPYSSATQQPI